MLKRWVPASFIAVAMVLAIAGGAVLAVGGANDSRKTDIFDRAAAILEIEASDLQDAYNQAKWETQDQRLANAIADLVEAEVIDQLEAGSFTEWMAKRPDVANEEIISKLTSSIFSSTGSRHLTQQFELHRHDFGTDSSLTDRIAEILGLDSGELTDALSAGEKQIEALDRLAKIYALIDAMLADETITNDEATKLGDWVDTMPQWLLDLDISSRFLSTIEVFSRDQHGRGLFEGLPFGKDRNRRGLLERMPFGREHFGDGDGEFRFEFKGPEGHFQFGPGEHDLPFDHEDLDELLEKFDFEMFEGLEGIEEFGGLEGLFEQFEGHEFSNRTFEEILPPTIEPDTSTTSA